MNELVKKIIIEWTHYRILISNVFSWNRLRFSLCLHGESSHCVLLGRMEKWPTVAWNKGVGVFFNGHVLLINTHSIPSLWPSLVQESWNMFGYSLYRLDNLKYPHCGRGESQESHADVVFWLMFRLTRRTCWLTVHRNVHSSPNKMVPTVLVIILPWKFRTTNSLQFILY